MATHLCKRLRLSIELRDAPQNEEEIVVRLTNDLTLAEIELCYPVGSNTQNKKYHRKEAMVIAMRRVIDQAVEEGLISVSRGVSMDLSGATEKPSPTTSMTGAAAL
jgi:hypothetical protein